MQNHRTSLVSILVGLTTIGLALAAPTGTVHAQAGKSLAGFDNICLTEARRAEAQHGIPKGLLQSISRVEAGRKTVTGEFMPWAWTLNDRGEGLFFDSREAAMRHLEEAVAAGDHSVDVGCMQVNTKWHMGGFHELADMLDPVQNADYAAGFLLNLHEAHQSWDAAVKHYHSAEPKKHLVYHRRVLAELELFLNSDDQQTEMAASLPDASDAADNSTGSSLDDQANDLADDLVNDLSRDLALRTPQISQTSGPVTGSTPAVPASVATSIPAPIPAPIPASVQTGGAKADLATGSTTNMGAMGKQPNLAPHWKRVEHFRRLLAEGAG
ncbi:MAG: hypothetical protein VXW17_08795 [Pseudomonadota bacterium]|nr:hypothetical protein [Pseudomonadota bacterium]MEC7238113.1 hypothetical protein [Pseudomonadota bacterium]